MPKASAGSHCRRASFARWWCALALVLSAACASLAAPRADAEPGVLDFGRVRADDPALVRRVRISNRGDDPLQLFGVESGCGCAEARLEHDIVPVGAATELTVRLNLLGRRGHYQRDVVLQTNDPRRPTLRIPVTAEIVSPWDLTPTGIAFGDLSAHQSVTQSLRLVFDPPTGRVESVSCLDSWLQARLQAERAGVWRIEVAAVPPYPSAGWLTGRIVLKTDRSDIGPIHVGCTAVIRQPLMLLPAELRLTPGSEGPHFVLISGAEARDLTIEQVTLNGRPLKWTARRLSDGALQLRLHDLAARAECDGQELEIHTASPPGRPLRLPLRVVSEH